MAQRCYYLDLTKVIAMFLVILGHLYSADSNVRLYLYSFHMPLFFLVSGIFYKDTGTVNWKRYCRTLLWPTVVFIVLFSLNGLLFRLHPVGYYLESFFIDLPLGRHKGYLWFIFALFWCKIFMDLWIKARRPLLTASLWALMLFVPLVLNQKLPFEMLYGLMAFPFYFIGYTFKRPLMSRTPSLKYVFPFVACLLLNFLITRFHGRVSMVSVQFGQLARQFGIEPANLPVLPRLAFLGGDVLLFYINGLIGSAAVICLSLLPFPKLSFIGKLSGSLITVYGTQNLFIHPFAQYVGLDYPFWVSIPLAAVVFALCYGLHFMLRPIYQIVREKSITAP